MQKPAPGFQRATRATWLKRKRAYARLLSTPRSPEWKAAMLEAKNGLCAAFLSGEPTAPWQVKIEYLLNLEVICETPKNQAETIVVYAESEETICLLRRVL